MRRLEDIGPGSCQVSRKILAKVRGLLFVLVGDCHICQAAEAGVRKGIVRVYYCREPVFRIDRYLEQVEEISGTERTRTSSSADCPNVVRAVRDHTLDEV